MKINAPIDLISSSGGDACSNDDDCFCVDAYKRQRTMDEIHI